MTFYTAAHAGMWSVNSMTRKTQTHNKAREHQLILKHCCPLLDMITTCLSRFCQLTWSIAGVSEAVGSEGLQRFMGEKSEAVTSRAGGLRCRILGGLRAFPELWVLTVVLLLTEEELVSVSNMLVSSPDRTTLLSICCSKTGSLFFSDIFKLQHNPAKEN